LQPRLQKPREFKKKKVALAAFFLCHNLDNVKKIN